MCITFFSAFVRAGEEITISYLAENNLLEPAYSRQLLIESTKDFICSCPRCTCPADLSRGFACPKCHEGPIFLHPNSGTARDQNLLNQNFAHVIPSTSVPPISSNSLMHSNSALKLSRVVFSKLEELIDPAAALTNTTDILDRLFSYRPFFCCTCEHKLDESELKTCLRRERKAMRFIKALENLDDPGHRDESSDKSSPISDYSLSDNPTDSANGTSSRCDVKQTRLAANATPDSSCAVDSNATPDSSCTASSSCSGGQSSSYDAICQYI